MAFALRLIEGLAALGGAVYLLGNLWSMFRRWRAARLLLPALVLVLAGEAEATAPARSAAWVSSVGLTGGAREYAESQCSDAAVILCEDFNWSDVAPYDGVGQGSCCQFYNPGLRVTNYGFKPQWAHQSIVPLTDYGTNGKQGGSMPSGAQTDRVLKMRSLNSGGVWWTIRANSTQTYMSGHSGSDARTFYSRFQVFFTSDFTWPGGTRTSTVQGSNVVQCYDTKIFYFWPPGTEDNPTGGHYDAGAHTQCGVADTSGSGPGGQNVWFADALALRYGNIGFPSPMSCPSPYKFLPLCAECQNFCQSVSGYDTRFNFQSGYAPFQSLTLVDPGETPTAGKVFRFDRGKWYTIKIMYDTSSADNVADGAIKMWVNGTKIYDEANLYTCGSGLIGECDGIGEVSIQPYHNQNDGPDNGNPNWDGYMLVDNVIISTADITDPSGGVSAPSPTIMFMNVAGLIHVLVFAGYFWERRSAVVRAAMQTWRYVLETPKEMYWVAKYKRAVKRWQKAAPLMLPEPKESYEDRNHLGIAGHRDSRQRHPRA